MSKPRRKLEGHKPSSTPSQDDPVDISGAWDGPPVGPNDNFGPESKVHKDQLKGRTPRIAKEENQ